MQIRLKEVALADLKGELKATRRVLEGVSDEKLDWRPHEKSWTLLELAAHLANLPLWQISALETDGFNFADPVPDRVVPGNREEILSVFDENVSKFMSMLDECSEEDLLKPWTLSHGEKELFSMPTVGVLRQWGMSHIVHHRGQLTVYLRLLDIPVPSTYGPTADEQPGQ